MGMSETSATKRTLLAGAVGNVLEWYDFALYGYFAPEIGRASCRERVCLAG